MKRHHDEACQKCGIDPRRRELELNLRTDVSREARMRNVEERALSIDSTTAAWAPRPCRKAS